MDFRELTSVDDIRLVQDMERRVWGCEDIDVSPVLLMVALVKSGALLLGAFIDGRMRGLRVLGPRRPARPAAALVAHDRAWTTACAVPASARS